jgi:hypothetical protein
MTYDQWIDSDPADDREYDPYSEDTDSYQSDNDIEIYCDVRPKRLF